jgi:hypothetical protein
MRTLSYGLCLIALLCSCKQDAFCLNCEEGSGGSSGTGAGGSGGDDAPDAGDGGAVEGGAGVSGDGGGGTAGAPVGCEPLGDEACNGLDDDCDGRFDENFDFTSNPRHCGGCDQACQSPNAETSCVDSQCQVLGCLSGYVDLDPSQDGCEYFCPVAPATDEDCNGLDDDCDGEIDEELSPPSASEFCNTLPNTPCANVGLTCARREMRTTWFCDYPDTVQFDPAVPNGIFPEETLCDGIDNDCDAVADDPFDVGEYCDDGRLGRCADGGERRCTANKLTTECDLSLAPDPDPTAGPDTVESCNGRDDNCDGIVDNTEGDKRVIDDMLHVMRDGLDFYIYKYEASRPDATSGETGLSNARACSKANALPWGSVSYAVASAACASAKLRLCSATEWQAACEGPPTARTYPYAGAYNGDACNGTNHDVNSGEGGIQNGSVPCGTLASCASADGALDMSGNLKEWTSEMRGMTGGENIYVVRGGSYESPKLGLTCQTDLSRASADTVLPSIGFRCCSDTPQ